MHWDGIVPIILATPVSTMVKKLGVGDHMNNVCGSRASGKYSMEYFIDKLQGVNKKLWL